FLDEDLQRKLQDIYSNSNLDCDKLSIISTNDGEVIAYLGNSYYDLSNMNFMPASTLKPFSVYLPSIEHNMLYTSTPVLDEETSFSGYKPQNVGGAYHGWISAKEALSKSLNIPAVKFLSYLGVEKSINFLNKIGIKTSENDHNLALALGGLTNGVSAFDLIEAYSVLQNYGIKNNCRFVDKILDENGKIIYQNNKKSTKICDPEDAYLVTDMLTETVKTGTAKKLSDFNFDIASKTGTNSLADKNLDLYNISYTTDRILFTWLGDATREGIENLSSSFHATSINKEILTEIYKDYQPKSFEVPENIVEKEIDLLEYEVNHKVILASENTPDRYKLKQKFKQNHQPIEDSSLYQAPNLDFSLELTDKGADINLNTKEIFNYTIKKVSNGKEEILADFSNLNNQQTIQDEKVFCYDKISYQIIAKNKYNNQIYYSEIKEVYPKEFLISRLKNQENIYKINTKKRWFV
ncbi:MAG: hypothetical protein IJX26_02555, partial [Clostridia bacterium]|nr:hypothetical protein [Clostridia bacterium]